MQLKALISGFMAVFAAALPARGQFTPAAKPAEPTVTMLGWADYVAPQVIEDFTRETGIKVIYDVFESETALESRLLEAKGVYDIATPPARLLPKLIAAGQLQKLDRAQLPTAQALWPEIGGKLAAADPGGQYALVHMWFGYGLAYDRRKAAERLPEAQMASWDALFRTDALKKFSNCGVQLPNDADLVLEVALLAGRYSPELRGPGEVRRAGEIAGRLRASVTEFRSGGAAGALADGEICLALLSASEAAQARERGKAGEPPKDIGFAVPKEGAPLAIDVTVMLKDAPHVTDATRFLAFLQRSDIAARNAAAAQLASGVAAAKALLPEAAKADRFIWPEDETIRRLVAVPAPDPGLRKTIEREWLKVKTGSYEPVPAPAKPGGKARPGGKPGKGGKDPETKAKAADAPGQPSPRVKKKARRPGGKAVE